MKLLFAFLFLIISLSSAVFAQDSLKKEFENPLDCALFLANTEKDEFSRSQNLRTIAYFFWKSGRLTDAVKTVESIPDDYQRTEELINLGKEFLKSGKNEEATRLLLGALKSIEVETDLSGNDEKMEFLVSSLIALGKIQETIKFAESIVDIEDKAFVLTQISELSSEKGQKNKALELSSRVLEIVENSKWEDIKLFTFLNIANIYSKNGELEKANKLFEKVVSNYQSLEFENIRKEEFIEKIIEGYVNLKEFEKALSLFQVSANLNDQRDLYKLAKLNQIAGNKEKADALLIQIEEMQKSENDSTDFIWSKIIDESIRSNDFNSALDSAKKLSSEYYQLKIVDQFIEQNKKALATELLNFILKKVEKIQSDEVETGRMSFSPQKTKASYLSDISRRFIEIKQFETALKIINSIEKPYYKAQALANLAVEQKSKNSLRLINQSLAIMRKTEDSMLDARQYVVWNEIAVGFAKIGDKKKAGEVFAELLSIHEETHSDFLETLAETGYYFEMSGIKSDEKVSNALKKIIQNWEEENN